MLLCFCFVLVWLFCVFLFIWLVFWGSFLVLFVFYVVFIVCNFSIVLDCKKIVVKVLLMC